MAKSSGASLVVAGSTVKVTHETVPIENILLNPDNPRIRFQIKRQFGSKRLNQTDLENLIRAQPGFDGLQKAIRKAGGLHDPIIVAHDGTVVEGNSRATVFKILHAGSKGDPRWKKILVARLPKGVPQKSTAMLMAAYHIAGKTVWRPYAQADQIYELIHTHGWKAEQIADETRKTTREIEQYIEAYNYLVKEVLPKANGNGDEILQSKFHHALEFVKRESLATYRKDPKVRKQLATLLIEDKIKGIEVRELDKVFKNPRASIALKREGFRAAREVLREADPVEASKTLKKMKAMTSALKKMGQKDIAVLKKSPKAADVLIDLFETVKNVASVAGIEINVRNG